MGAGVGTLARQLERAGALHRLVVHMKSALYWLSACCENAKKLVAISGGKP